MSWKGDWNKDGNAFVGTYTFADDTVFEGEARYVDKHVLVHMNADGFTKTVEHPVEPHFEFTGTWKKGNGAGSPMMPPDPDPPKHANAPAARV